MSCFSTRATMSTCSPLLTSDCLVPETLKARRTTHFWDRLDRRCPAIATSARPALQSGCAKTTSGSPTTPLSSVDSVTRTSTMLTRSEWAATMSSATLMSMWFERKICLSQFCDKSTLVPAKWKQVKSFQIRSPCQKTSETSMLNWTMAISGEWMTREVPWLETMGFQKTNGNPCSPDPRLSLLNFPVLCTMQWREREEILSRTASGGYRCSSKFFPYNELVLLSRNVFPPWGATRQVERRSWRKLATTLCTCKRRSQIIKMKSKSWKPRTLSWRHR